MTEPKKLIEVAMPVKEVSAESVRDGRVQHGHISSLHKWWARRPLPVCRAVVFASLVPDPLDPDCPAAFRQAVAKYLAGKEYKPYDDIPHTAAIDPMDDNLRNRLLMFIGKFSDEYIANEKIGKSTDSKKQLSDGSLIKWENKNNPKIIGTARKLIFIAHNTNTKNDAEGFSPSGEMSAGQRGDKADLVTLEAQYNSLWTAITTAEKNLYSTPNRHLETPEIYAKEKALHEAIENYLDKMPRVFDPFAGGGAIPLEAARLGCRTFGNDLNPVAHIIQRGSVEFPQKYGKPITYTREEFLKQYPVFAEKTDKQVTGNYTLQHNIETLELEGYEDALSKHSDIHHSSFILLKNRLAFDVEYFARQMLAGAEKEIGQYYPEVNSKKPIAYYWAHVGTCSNPSCRAEVPLLKQFYLVNKPGKKVFLNPVISGNTIDFEIKEGEYALDGWMARGNLFCPCCGNTTDVKTLKSQFLSKQSKVKLIAVIEEGDNGKNYRLPNESEINVPRIIPDDIIPPSEPMPVKYTQALPSCTWGLETWGQMFSCRQLLAMQTFVNQLTLLKSRWRENKGELDDYQKALATYLGIFVNRIAARETTFGLIDVGRETIVDLFGRQAIPMVFDFPELVPFKLEQISWIIKIILEEGQNQFAALVNNSSSGEKSQFRTKYLNAAITDPPYYDAIAYADLSDFFYVWLKRTLGDVFPFNFATPQTPKTEECTALKHHHRNDYEIAKQHFENKLQQIFSAIEQQTSGVVCIMFAHQSTEAWTTLCNSILGANMNITGSWAVDSETTTALKSDKAFLSSSVTVSCRPNTQTGYISFKAVKKNIEERVKKEVKLLYEYGFRGADLLTACFGQAVSEFGQYQTVEKADGTKVEVKELLELAREAAFNAIISDIDTDEVTKFYIGWLNLYGFAEAEHDDVTGITKVGLSIEVSLLQQHHVFERNGNKESLSGYKVRCNANQKLGTQATSFAIDRVHKAMSLFESGNRAALTEYLGQVAPTNDASFWRICTALAEVLPSGCDDHKQLTGLLTNKESLIREAQRRKQETPEQGTLGL